MNNVDIVDNNHKFTEFSDVSVLMLLDGWVSSSSSRQQRKQWRNNDVAFKSADISVCELVVVIIIITTTEL